MEKIIPDNWQDIITVHGARKWICEKCHVIMYSKVGHPIPKFECLCTRKIVFTHWMGLVKKWADKTNTFFIEEKPKK